MSANGARAFRRAMLAGIGAMIAMVGVTGCFDRSELEEQAFLVTMMIDQKKAQGPITVTARVAVPSKLSGSSGGSGGGGGGSSGADSGTPVVTASGRTLHEAIGLMNTGVERTINLSHIAGVIFGEHAARLGLLSYVRPLVRFREFRRTLYLFVADGSVGDVILKDKPVLETSVTRVIEDLHQTSERTGYAPSVQMHEFLGNLETPNEDPVLPILSYNKQVGSESQKSAGSPKHLKTDNVAGASPGTINRAGGNPVECVGTAVFRGDRMVGRLDGEETRYLQLLNGHSQRMVVILAAPLGPPGYLSLGVRYAEPAHIKVSVHQNPPTILISQSFETELLGDETAQSYVDNASKSTLEHALADYIAKREALVIHKVFVEMGADPFHFFAYARGQFPTYAAMSAYDWRKHLPDVKVTIKTEATLRRMGTQLSPPVDLDAQLAKGVESPPPKAKGSKDASQT
ncbi:MAG: Ger(x)C family spore germination protein [Firmicutes bacterium]|nr:Ger(x)C family spore germination protein [Bacillota bacterium]